MRLTTKGRYALTAMLDLALHPQDMPIALGILAARQNIPLPYLEQLAVRLRQDGLLSSVRGPKGGYRLGRDPSDISVADIIRATEDSLDARRCGGADGGCQAGQRCLTHVLWHELNQQVDAFLGNKSLAELASRLDIQAIAARQDAAQLMEA